MTSLADRIREMKPEWLLTKEKGKSYGECKDMKIELIRKPDVLKAIAKAQKEFKKEKKIKDKRLLEVCEGNKEQAFMEALKEAEAVGRKNERLKLSDNNTWICVGHLGRPDLQKDLQTNGCLNVVKFDYPIRVSCGEVFAYCSYCKKEMLVTTKFLWDMQQNHRKQAVKAFADEAEQIHLGLAGITLKQYNDWLALKKKYGVT